MNENLRAMRGVAGGHRRGLDGRKRSAGVVDLHHSTSYIWTGEFQTLSAQDTVGDGPWRCERCERAGAVSQILKGWRRGCASPKYSGRGASLAPLRDSFVINPTGIE